MATFNVYELIYPTCPKEYFFNETMPAHFAPKFELEWFDNKDEAIRRQNYILYVLKNKMPEWFSEAYGFQENIKVHVINICSEIC